MQRNRNVGMLKPTPPRSTRRIQPSDMIVSRSGEAVGIWGCGLGTSTSTGMNWSLRPGTGTNAHSNPFPAASPGGTVGPPDDLRVGDTHMGRRPELARSAAALSAADLLSLPGIMAGGC